MCLRRVLAGRAVGRERWRDGEMERWRDGEMDSRAPRAACPPGKGRRRQESAFFVIMD